MNYLYILYRIFFLFLCYFLPDIARPFYCYFKRKFNNTYKCSYWTCKNYSTCFYNEKTLLDFKPSHEHPDILWYVISLIFIFIFTIVFTFIELFLINHLFL